MSETMDARVLPHNINAEGGVLSAMLMDCNCIAFAVDMLTEPCFYRRAHQLIFRSIRELFEKDETVDAYTVLEHLERKGNLEKVGGIPYVNEISSMVMSPAHCESHCRIVYDLALRRQLIIASWGMAESGYNSDRPVQDLLSDADQSIQSISDTHITDISMQAAIIDAMTTIQQPAGAGCNTGFYYLDRMIGNFKPGQFTVLAARPKMGKSSLAMEIATHNAKQGRKIAVFSLEMSRDELLLRMVAQSGTETMDALFTSGDFSAAAVALQFESMESLPIYIDDGADKTPLRIKAKCRQLQKGKGLDMVIIDYLGLLNADQSKKSRYEEITQISRALKIMAKVLKVPVMALHQLNRELENRDDKRPRLSDLRDSGGIEQDADKVLFIYRDEVYYPDTTDFPGVAEIICRKNRNGRDGIVSFHWDGDHIRFNTLENRER
jgi:replicative DNA helicase